MATRAATAIRQETATARIIGAAQRIGLDQAELRSDPRDRETQLAEVLEQCAAMMEAAAEVIERLAAGEQPQKDAGALTQNVAGEAGAGAGEQPAEESAEDDKPARGKAKAK